MKNLYACNRNFSQWQKKIKISIVYINNIVIRYYGYSLYLIVTKNHQSKNEKQIFFCSLIFRISIEIKLREREREWMRDQYTQTLFKFCHLILLNQNITPPYFIDFLPIVESSTSFYINSLLPSFLFDCCFYLDVYLVVTSIFLIAYSRLYMYVDNGISHEIRTRHSWLIIRKLTSNRSSVWRAHTNVVLRKCRTQQHFLVKFLNGKQIT